MKKIFFVLGLLPILGYAQNCHLQKNLIHQRIILTAPDKPFFPISDVILEKNTWKIKTLHGKYRSVSVKNIGNNLYRFNLNKNQFAVIYPDYQNDKNFSQYQIFSHGGFYNAKLFYKNQRCHEIDYMEIDVIQKHNGQTHQLKQKFYPSPNIVRYG